MHITMQKKLPPKNTYTKTTANALKPHVGSLKEILSTYWMSFRSKSCLISEIHQ